METFGQRPGLDHLPFADIPYGSPYIVAWFEGDNMRWSVVGFSQAQTAYLGAALLKLATENHEV